MSEQKDSASEGVSEAAPELMTDDVFKQRAIEEDSQPIAVGLTKPRCPVCGSAEVGILSEDVRRRYCRDCTTTWNPVYARVHQPEQNLEGKLAFELSWKDIQSFEHVQAALAELEKIDTAHVASNGLSTEATAISAARVLLDGYFELQESKIVLRQRFRPPVTEQNLEDKNSGEMK